MINFDSSHPGSRESRSTTINHLLGFQQQVLHLFPDDLPTQLKALQLARFLGPKAPLSQVQALQFYQKTHAEPQPEHLAPPPLVQAARELADCAEIIFSNGRDYPRFLSDRREVRQRKAALMEEIRSNRGKGPERLAQEILYAVALREDDALLNKLLTYSTDNPLHRQVRDMWTRQYQLLIQQEHN